MAHLSQSTPPLWVPPTASKRTSSPSDGRLSSSPLPGSSFFDSKSPSGLPSSVPKSYATPSGSSLHPPFLQRPKSTNTSPRLQTPSHPPSAPHTHADTFHPSISHKPSMLHRSNTVHAGAPSERPVLPSRSSTLPHVRTSPFPYTATTVKDADDDATRRRVRAEMLQWVKSEVESIEKETEAVAQRNLTTRQGMRRRGSTLVEPPTPDRLAEINSFRASTLVEPPTPDRLAESTSFPSIRRVHSRRGSVDSAVAGGWKPVEIPRKAKDWEKWAETKVQARRKLDEVWTNEDEVLKETERLIKETQAQDRIRREREARRQWDRQAFLEKERQRAVREEQERLGEQKRTQQLQDALNAETRRQQELEREVRRIEQEARRLEEELLRNEKKRQQADAAARMKAQPERPKEQHANPQPTATYGPTWQPFDLGLESDSDYFGAEWERFAEIFRLGANRANTKPKYQSPAMTFKEAWESYETRWSQLSKPAPHPGGDVTKATPPRFGFADIPWPVLHQPSKATDVASLMTESSIASFILSPFHCSSGVTSSSPNVDTKTRKARLRDALLRWHPDKMARILLGIPGEDERECVKAGAEAVARHLNALLARES